MTEDTFKGQIFGKLSGDAECFSGIYKEKNPETFVNYGFKLQDVFDYFATKNYD